MQNELRDHQHAVEKTGLRDIGNAAVDDHAGIQNLVVVPDCPSPRRKRRPRAQIQQLALGRAGDRAEIDEQQQADHLHEVQRWRCLGAVTAQHHADQRGADQSRHYRRTMPIRRFRLTRSTRVSRSDRNAAQAPPGQARPAHNGVSAGRK